MSTDWRTLALEAGGIIRELVTNKRFSSKAAQITLLEIEAAEERSRQGTSQEEALLVAMDYALDTEQWSDELRARVVELLPAMRIGLPWSLAPGAGARWTRRILMGPARSSLASVYHRRAAPTLGPPRVSGDLGVMDWTQAVELSRDPYPYQVSLDLEQDYSGHTPVYGTYASAEEGQAAADAELRRRGWYLI